MSEEQLLAPIIKPQVANKPMLVTAKEQQLLLRLRQLKNAEQGEARVKLPDMKIEAG